MKTKVVFRKFYKERDLSCGDNVIALFPEEKDFRGLINSYMHIGQHGPAHVFITNWTKLATPEEYQDLKEELISIGYDLEIRKRIRR